MFKRKYKYIISFWYELEDKQAKIRSGILIFTHKLENEEVLNFVRQKLVEAIEVEEQKKCNCVGIINWKRIK